MLVALRITNGNPEQGRRSSGYATRPRQTIRATPGPASRDGSRKFTHRKPCPEPNSTPRRGAGDSDSFAVVFGRNSLSAASLKEDSSSDSRVFFRSRQGHTFYAEADGFFFLWVVVMHWGSVLVEQLLGRLLARLRGVDQPRHFRLSVQGISCRMDSSVLVW